MSLPSFRQPPPSAPRPRSKVLAGLGVTFAVVAILFAATGNGPAVGLAVLFALAALVMSVVEIAQMRSGSAVVAVVASGLAVLVAIGAVAGTGSASSTTTSSVASADTAPAYVAPSYTPSYTAPAYSPPSTYTPAPVYVAPTTTTTEEPPPPPEPQTFTYRITGAKVANSITYSTGGMNQAQDTNVRVPWRRTVPKGDSYMVFGYVSAQNAGGGSISCTLTDDSTGEVLAQNTATGPYAIVSCTNS